jgi:hypothetical protein
MQQMVDSQVGHLNQTWPVDMGGAFFLWTYRQGSSNVIHMDPMDYEKGLAFVFAFGDFQECNLVFPTLKKAVPLSEGQMMAFNAHLLPHFASEIEGKGVRYGLTCFTDKQTACKARNIPLQAGLSISQLGYYNQWQTE